MNIVKNTPIITHFKNMGLPVPEHFNQSIMLSCAKRLNMFTLKASFNILIQYHDMLRSVWNGEHLNIRDVTDSNLFYLEEHNLKNTADVEEAMLPICDALQSSINLAHGPLMRIAVFHLPEKDVVLMVIHHLVVDGVSWRILTEDLNKIYTTLLQGKLSVGMPKRKCSFAQYAQALNDYAMSEVLLREESYWQNVVNAINTGSLLCQHLTHEQNTATFQLDIENTQKLLSEGNKKFDADINALLLTALSRAWKEVMGLNVLSLSQEGHGREQFGSQPLALERLVGWFTTIFPVALVCEESDLRTQIAATQAMLRSIPNKGFGYGVLTCLAGKKNLVCDPLMTFNYLGSFDETSSDSIFTLEHTLPQGNSSHVTNKADTALSINCAVADGTLSGDLSYDTGILDSFKAETLCTVFVSQLKKINEQE